MKNLSKIWIAVLIFFASITVNAQYIDKDITADTVKGNENIYFTYSGKPLNSKGFDLVSGFNWTISNTAGTVDAVYLQGSQNGTNWVTIATETTPSDGSYFTYDRISTSQTLTTTTITNAYTSAIASSVDTCGGVADTATFTAADTATSTTTSTLTETGHVPITLYNYYRLWVDGGVGDTAIFNPVNFSVIKREE